MDYSVFNRLNEEIILSEFNLIRNSNQICSSKLKSLNWRNSFNLSSTSSTSTSILINKLNQSRNYYQQLKLKYSTSPQSSNSDSLQVDNPLSNELGNVWSTWFKDLDLKKIIHQDVERSFPEINYFKHKLVQHKLSNLLFIYSKLNQSDGYSQGLHEILAPILFLCDLDSLPSSSTTISNSTTPLSNEALARLVLCRDFIEHDTFTLFQAIMKHVRVFYDSNPSVALPIERLSPNSQSTINSRSTIINNSINSSAPKLLVQPIVGIANRIQDKLLKTYDFDLYSTLVALEIEPQIYVMRWLRLLFSREFSFNEIIELWTGLFAEDSELKLVEYIVVAMLLRIREAIITHQEDYTNALQLLLRYPLPNFQTSFKIEILLRQAIYLRDNTTAEAGERCRQENIDLGLESGEIDEEKRSRTPDSSVTILPPNPPSAATPVVYSTGQIAAALLVEGVGGIARRAELMGVNKALIGTFNDIRRGVNSIDSEFPARAFARDRDSAVELNRLRNENLAMSRALETCVNILQNRFDIAPKKDEEGEDGKGIMTLTVINHIKQVLAGSTHFDRHVLSPLTAVSAPPLSSSASVTATTSSPVNSSPPTLQQPTVSTPPLLLGQRSAPPPLSSLTRTLDPKLSSTASTSSALPPKSIAPPSPTTFPPPPPPVLTPVENRFAAASQRMDLSKRRDRKYEDRIEDPLGVGVDVDI